MKEEIRELESKLATVLDKIFVFFIRSLAKSILITPDIFQCLQLITKRIKSLLEKIKKAEASSSSSAVIENLVESAVALIYNTGWLIPKAPLAFQGLIAPLLQLSLEIINFDWKNSLLLKSGLILGLRVIRQPFFSCEPELILQRTSQRKSTSAVSQNQDKLLACRKEFVSFFNPELVLELFKRLIGHTLDLVEQDSADMSVEDLIDEEDLSKLEKLNSELDYSPRKIALFFIKNLIHKFPEGSFPLITQLLHFLKNSDDSANQIPDSAQLNLISILSLLPGIYDRLDVPPHQILELSPCLELLYNKRGDVRFCRRFPLLVRYHIDYLTPEQRQNCFQILPQYLQVPDVVTQYHALSCFKQFIKQDRENSINYEELLKQLLPTTVSVCREISAAHQVYRMIQIFQIMVERLGGEEGFNFSEFLEILDLKEFINLGDPLIDNAVYDLLKTMVLSRPLNTPLTSVYSVTVSLITHRLKSLEAVTIELLKFWAFVLKEIPICIENHKLLEQLAWLFRDKIELLARIEERSKLEFVYSVVDNCLLLGKKAIHKE